MVFGVSEVHDKDGYPNRQLENKNLIDKKIEDEEEKEKERSVPSRIAAGILNVGSYYRKKTLKAEPVRFLGRLAGKVVGAAALGTVGLIAGISSGSAKDAFTYTVGAASLGSRLGKTVSENIMDEAHANKESFSRGYLGEEDYTNKQLDKEFYKNEEIAQFVNNDSLHPEMRGNIIKETRRRTLLSKEIQAYRSAGITDNKKIAKAIKLGLTPQQGVYAIELADRLGKSGYNNPKIRMDFKERYGRALGEKGIGTDEWETIWYGVSNILF